MIDINKLKSGLESAGIEFLESEKLSDYSTFKIGGECPIVIKPTDENQIIKTVKLLCDLDLPYYIFGNGSNLLISDKGLSYPVILLGKNYSGITVEDETLICLAGTSLADVCLAALENSLTGLEFAYGIPGTVGGAAFMNAGAYDGEIKEVCLYCDVINEKGEPERITADKANFAYRDSVFMHRNVVISKVAIKLKKGDKDKIKARMDELMVRRKSRQPLEYPSAGSTFKRPVGNYASALIEQCGLKGYTVGGAMVSEKHCGFVINHSNASFDDVLAVIEHVKKTVYEKTGYKLECEVKILT